VYYEHEHYVNRAMRDARAADLKLRGARNVKKRSSRGSVLSPNYVEDYSGHTSPDGFGGLAAQYFSTLYTVEWQY
jgi:hypothetical protein